jgi:hypothetical protein
MMGISGRQRNRVSSCGTRRLDTNKNFLAVFKLVDQSLVELDGFTVCRRQGRAQSGPHDIRESPTSKLTMLVNMRYYESSR